MKNSMLLVLCAAFGLAGAHAASAAAAGDDIPRLVLHYHQDSLATDGGAEALYRRIKKASVDVCPNTSAGRPFVPTVILQCREQAVARAVHQINSPRLAAVYAASGKSG